MEVWKPIKDFPGYEVSDQGRVRSYHNNKWGLQEEPHLLSLRNNKGYRYVTIEGKNLSVHRLVGKTFIPNPHNHPMVLHGNNIRHDNRVSNLRWGTGSDNTKQGVEDGNIDTEKCRQVKLENLTTYVFTKEGQPVIIKNIPQWLRDNGHPEKSGNLYQVIRGKRKSSYGLKPLFTPLPVV